MNNEIKEILYVLKHIVIGRASRLTSKEAKALLDYITNLQQDNEMYAQLKDEYEEEIKDLQQENERLKNDLENEIADNKLRWQEYNYFKNKYIEERTKNVQVLEILHNINDTLPLDIILSEIEHSEYILQNGSEENE